MLFLFLTNKRLFCFKLTLIFPKSVSAVTYDNNYACNKFRISESPCPAYHEQFFFNEAR